MGELINDFILYPVPMLILTAICLIVYVFNKLYKWLHPTDGIAPLPPAPNTQNPVLETVKQDERFKAGW